MDVPALDSVGERHKFVRHGSGDPRCLVPRTVQGRCRRYGFSEKQGNPE